MLQMNVQKPAVIGINMGSEALPSALDIARPENSSDSHDDKECDLAPTASELGGGSAFYKANSIKSDEKPHVVCASDLCCAISLEDINPARDRLIWVQNDGKSIGSNSALLELEEGQVGRFIPYLEESFLHFLVGKNVETVQDPTTRKLLDGLQIRMSSSASIGQLGLLNTHHVEYYDLFKAANDHQVRVKSSRIDCRAAIKLIGLTCVILAIVVSVLPHIALIFIPPIWPALLLIGGIFMINCSNLSTPEIE